jgi:hypothetical protein
MTDSGIKEALAATDVNGQMELRVKVAELCPDLFEIHQTWRGPEGGGFQTYLTKKGEGVSGDEIDPLNDLNACAEFEEAMTEEQRYNYTLTLLRLPRIGYGGTEPMACCFPVLHATAEQRCLAFVKTMEAASVPNVPDSSSASSSPCEKTATETN